MAAPAPARANAIRFTRTDVCGVPVAEATANSRLTTAGFVEVGMALDVFTSSDIAVTGADGAQCVFSKGQNTLRGIDITLSLCSFNESIMEMLLGSTILVDGADNVGAVVGADGTINTNTVMVEWWSTNANSDACAAGGRGFTHHVLPRVNRWVLTGNTDFGDTATTLQFAAYAEPSTAYAASRAADEIVAADVAAANAASAVYFFREVTALPAQIPGSGFDV